ncbi:hypothetical protein MTP04_06970 [Lysinibacillus sp. PLM2]|nr:hypothetical protein MTP04_06970 [Lysinibacillus sp. PLM2]
MDRKQGDIDIKQIGSDTKQGDKNSNTNLAIKIQTQNRSILSQIFKILLLEPQTL